MTALRVHRKLGLFILLAAVCVLGVLRGKIEENILALVPKPLQQQVALFEHSPLGKKLIVLVQASNAEDALAASVAARQQLLDAKLIRPPMQAQEEIIGQMLSALPGRFTPADEKTLQAKISLAGIAAQLARYQEQLFSLDGLFAKQLLVKDPLFLTQLMWQKWAQLASSTQTGYQDGFLATEDGTLQAGLYDATADVSNWAAAQKLQHFFTQLQRDLPAGVRAFFMGGLRYTFENVTVIKHDLIIISLVGITLLAGIFFLFFRTKQAVLIYALPLLVLAPAALVTQVVFGRISGITLGFGSVVAGLCVDYAIYVYFTLMQTQSKQLPASLRAHLWCNFITSALCFAALLFSSVEVFKQIAVFALVALSLAFLIAWFVFPPYFADIPKVADFSSGIKFKPLSLRTACAVCAVVVLFGVWGAFHTSFSEGLDSLNSTSPAFVQDKRVTDTLFAADKQALLFSLGQTPDEALSANEKLSARLPVPLAVSALFVSTDKQHQNQNRWQEFWSPARQTQTRQAWQQVAKKAGFNAQAFEPFWTWLANSSALAPVDVSNWYNPLIRLSATEYAVMNVVSDEPVYAQAANDNRVVFVSASALQKTLSRAVKREAVWVVCLALLFNMFAVGILFKNVREVLLCFVPVVLGGCVLFGCLALFKLHVNLFGLIFLPLLIGLGIDYAIFQLLKYRGGSAQIPTRALVAAGLSTLAGFGVLVLAKHAVLFMMGVCALLGIGGAVLAAVFVLPAFLEKHV